MIEFKSYQNKLLDRILFLSENNQIKWKKTYSLNGVRYRGISLNHIFSINIFNENKKSYIGYIKRNITSIEDYWLFIKDNQEIINLFIDKIIDLIDTQENYTKVDFKYLNNFISYDGEILIDDNKDVATKYFDEEIMIKTYRLLNKEC